MTVKCISSVSSFVYLSNDTQGMKELIFGHDPSCHGERLPSIQAENQDT